MTTSSKISLSIFILALIVFGAYGFSVFRDRNNDLDENNIQESEEQERDVDESTDYSSVDSESENSATDSLEDSDDEDINPENTNYLDVSRTDCDNQCKDFTDPDDLKYCQQICGLTPIKKDVEEKNGCDTLQDLERDYCFKDLAITKKDINLCTQISDTNIFKTCKNRITQDAIEILQ